MPSPTWNLRLAMKGGGIDLIEGIASSDAATELAEHLMRQRRAIDTVLAYTTGTDPADGDCAVWFDGVIVWAIPEERLYS